MPDRLLGVLRHQRLELALRALVVEKGFSGVAEECCELSPRVRRAHIDNADGLDARPWRLDAEEARGIAVFDAAPEFLLCGQQEVLVEWISGDRNFNPLAAAGDH